VTLKYAQTQCADPWRTGASDSETLAHINHYLDSLNLYVADLTLKKEGDPVTCLACTCITGKVIYVSTLNSEAMKEKYLALGFRQ
jgi:hypothetical protein